MKKSIDAWDVPTFTVKPVLDAWSSAQSQFAEVLRWSTAQGIQARAWLNATRCSASEHTKRLLALTDCKSVK